MLARPYETSSHYGSRLLVVFLALFLALSPLSVELELQKTNAATGCAVAYLGKYLFGIGATGTAAAAVLSVPTNDIAANVSHLPAQTALQSTLSFKECVLDPLAWFFAKAIISKIVDSLVTWINSGFEGGPAFVTDLSAFMLGVADKAAADFLLSNDQYGIIKLLCSPISLDIQISLILKYFKPRAKALECTASKIFKNGAAGFTNFINGTFSEGGWGEWFTLNASPQNNPSGAYLMAEGELSVRINDAKLAWKTPLDWGKGFFGLQCLDDEHALYTCTPGTYIANAVDSTLAESGLQGLISADEIDEILGALFNQLFLKTLEFGKGLLGLEESPYMSDFRKEYQDALSEKEGDQCTDAVTVGNEVLACVQKQTASTTAAAAVQNILTTVQTSGVCRSNAGGAAPSIDSQAALRKAQDALSYFSAEFGCQRPDRESIDTTTPPPPAPTGEPATP